MWLFVVVAVVAALLGGAVSAAGAVKVAGLFGELTPMVRDVIGIGVWALVAIALLYGAWHIFLGHYAKCPHCASWIPVEATTCRHCQKAIEPAQP